ncbi:MAG TPA: maleylpyruvate isomerase family mycothiol-dependent enzyme [Streptosporangiaceae bacterium]|nr:maleylpyruvate isomerase family mycothiol-dependent enzyme [Streptosporangiaceae bacterium]
MKTAHETAAALLGVWALDACSPEEAELVTDHLPECATCAAEAARLRGAADLLGAAAAPPEWLRARTMERAKARRSAASPCPGYAEPYAAQVSVLDSLLGELSAADWRVNVIYDWHVQDVVAHLAATDGLVAAGVGTGVGTGAEGGESGGPPPAVGDSVLGDLLAASTAAAIDRERRRPPDLTRASWRAQADALCRALPADAAHRVPGIRLRISDLVVARAFETWVHSDDIATAVRRRLPPPLPRHLAPIAALGVRSLPKALAVTRADRPAAVAQVVLDGPGGGEWRLGLGAGDGGGAPPEPAVRLRMDVLEFCFLAGGRRDPATVDAEVVGDRDLGRELLAAAPSFSGP